jgi:hypothetical protein
LLSDEFLLPCLKEYSLDSVFSRVRNHTIVQNSPIQVNERSTLALVR